MDNAMISFGIFKGEGTKITWRLVLRREWPRMVMGSDSWLTRVSRLTARRRVKPAPSAEQKIDFANGLYQRGYGNAASSTAIFDQVPEGGLREIALFRQGESFYQQAVREQKENPVLAVTYLKARRVLPFIRVHPKSGRIHEALPRQGEISYKSDDSQTGADSLQRSSRKARIPPCSSGAVLFRPQPENWARRKRRKPVPANPLHLSQGEYAAFHLPAGRSAGQAARKTLFPCWPS